MKLRDVRWALYCALLAGCGPSHRENRSATPTAPQDTPGATPSADPKPSAPSQPPSSTLEPPEPPAQPTDTPRPEVWTVGFPSDIHATCAGLFEGADDTFYVVGSFNGGPLPDHRSDEEAPSTGAHLTRSAADGRVVWRRYIRGAQVEAIAAAQDAAGNIYVLGHQTGSVYLGDGERFATRLGARPDEPAAFIAKFQATNGHLVWARPVAGDCSDVRGTDLAVTPQGVVLVAGHYSRLGREAFVERHHQDDGEVTRRITFDYPGFRGPLRIATDATTLIVTGGMGEKIEVPNQHRFLTLAGESESGSFVAWYNIAEFALRDAQALADVDVLALTQQETGKTALVTAQHNQKSAAFVRMFDPQHRAMWWEPVSAAPDRPVRIRFGNNGALVVSRSFGAWASADARRVEQGIPEVRGEADAAVTIFSDRDIAHSQTFTAGGSGLTIISDALLTRHGAVHVCGQHTETAAFWSRDAQPVVLRAGAASATFISKFRPRL